MNKAALSWSSGKDAALAFLLSKELYPDLQIDEIFTVINKEFNRVSIHGVRTEILLMQARKMDIKLSTIDLPNLCELNKYEEMMEQFFDGLQARGIRDIVFGDLYLEDIRSYRENQLAKHGIKAHFPLWKLDTKFALSKLIAANFKAVITCIDRNKLPINYLGKALDYDFLINLPANVDPCGENGEYHSVVLNAPYFLSPIPYTLGHVIEKDNFSFIDVVMEDNNTTPA